MYIYIYIFIYILAQYTIIKFRHNIPNPGHIILPTAWSYINGLYTTKATIEYILLTPYLRIPEKLLNLG